MKIKKRTRQVQVDQGAQGWYEQMKEVLQPDDEVDKAVREFAFLYHEVAESIANARNLRRDYKDEYDEVLGRSLVAHLEEKTTVALAKEKAELTPAVLELKKRLRAVDAELERLEALMKSFEKKSSMLKAEVELIATSYAQRDHIKPKTRRY